MENNLKSRKTKDILLISLVYLSAIITVGLLLVIVGFIFIKGIGKINLSFLFADYSASGNGGILPMIITTVYMVLVAILVATPIGILAAVYLQEYAKQGRLVRIIRYSTEALAGIPSIVYGLFGAAFFVTTLKFGYSLIAGSLTLAIIILPVIIRTTEEALKVVPPSYREASLGLGATRFQTLYKVILPSAIPGILSGVILSMGRVIGESAALFLTAGTVYKIPTSIMSSGRTLTVHAFLETKEKGDIASAAAAGIVLIVMIFILNLLAKFVSKKFNKANY